MDYPSFVFFEKAHNTSIYILSQINKSEIVVKGTIISFKLGMKNEKKYDLIISGINRGYNLGDDIVYSGTCGAIFEGSRLYIKGLAISTDPDNLLEAPKSLDMIWEYIQKNNLYDKGKLCHIALRDSYDQRRKIDFWI